MENKVFILDTSALIGGFTPSLRETTQFIVPQVLAEARSLSVKLKLETAINSGQIKVRKPSKEALDKVREEVEKTRDRVSKTDIQLLALGQELQESGKNPILITDDYAIQNLAEILEIQYKEVAKPGISDVYEWERNARRVEEYIKKI